MRKQDITGVWASAQDAVDEVYHAARQPGRPTGTTKPPSEKMARVLSCIRPDQKAWLLSELAPANYSEWIRGKIDEEMEARLRL